MAQTLVLASIQQGKVITPILQTGIQVCSDDCVKTGKIQDISRDKYTGDSFLIYCGYIQHRIINKKCIDCMKYILDRAKVCYSPYKRYDICFEEAPETWFTAIRKGRADILELFISSPFFKNYKTFGIYSSNGLNSIEYLFSMADSISTEDLEKILKLFIKVDLLCFKDLHGGSCLYKCITDVSKRQLVKELLKSCRGDIEKEETSIRDIIIETKNRLEKEKDYSLQKLREEATKELTSRGFQEEIIKIYVDYIE